MHRPRGRADLLRRAVDLPGDAGADLGARRARTGADRPSRRSRTRSSRWSRRRLSRSSPRRSNSVADSQGAGVALILGVLLALWSASGYVGAFGRAMNKIYEIEEGRPFWKLRPIMLLLTLIAVTLAAIALLMLIVSGPVAESIGSVIGLGDTAITVWSIAKWPVLALIVILVVALLYYATPNVKQPKFRWISVGAARGDRDLGARVGRVRVLRRQLLQLQQDLRIAGGRHRRRCCSCGSPTWPCCSVASWTPSSNGAGSCRQASPPRRRSSSRRGTPATSRRPARSGTRTSRSDERSAARRRRTAHRTGSTAPRRERNEEATHPRRRRHRLRARDQGRS